MFHSPREEARTEDGLMHAVQSLQLSHRSRNTNREPKGCPCSTHRSHRAPFPRDEPGQPRTVPGRGSKIPGCGLRELWVFFLLWIVKELIQGQHSQHHPALPALVYGTWVPHFPLESSQQAIKRLTDATPLFYLWMTTSNLWERFPGVLTSARFSQGFFTKVELWEAGNTF